MRKIAVIFVNGLGNDPSRLVKTAAAAVMNAYSLGSGIFSKKKPDGIEVVPVQVIDIQTLWGLWYNAEKFGLRHYLQTNDKNSMDPMQTVLAVGPEEGDRLNKMSANLRLF